ncbi:MAG: metal ABC transporter permease [Pseudothermotoga sp.]
MNIINDILNFAFLRYALIATLIVSISTATISPIIVYRGMEFIGDGLAHAIFAGVAFAVIARFNIFIGAMIATAGFAYLIYKLNNTQIFRESTAIGILLPVFMSIGVIIFSKSPRYTTDVTSYLFGNILMVAKRDIYFLSVVAVVTIVVVFTKLYDISYWIFDETMAKFYGVNVNLVKLLILFLTSFVVVSALKIAGVIVMGAFLVLPGVFAKTFAKSLKEAIIKAISFNLAISFIGFVIAYYFDLPPGPTLVLLGFCVLIALGLNRETNKKEIIDFLWLVKRPREITRDL